MKPTNHPSLFTRKIFGMVSIFRPELPAAAAICVLAGQILAAGRLPSLSVGLLGFLCGFALSSAALILNDYFDYEVDLINHPNRPLPSGAVTRREVIGLTVVTTMVGLGAALALGLDALLIGIVFWVIGVLYNWRYKQTGLAGNLMVAASVGVTFVLGGVTMGEPWNPIVWTFAGMAFFIDLGEEIAGDAMDMEGDRARNCRTIALQKDRDYALRITVALWGLVILLSFLPFLIGWLGLSYLVFILITDLVLVVFSVRLLKSQTPESGRAAMRGAYIGATLGIIGFLIGRFLG
ncbi:MAG: UbiA family prenyltransferase [Anaerolineaceae bacterium]